ncbi:MAG: hypothetical protein GY913_03175 [Proteobacteria bacterium]|nr:hypothetical protein [Pseudomonadota bacterium]MCP4915902.1 hypothetical protein [Pseudomonadota bacterium]
MVGLILACSTCPEGDIELNGECIETTVADVQVSAGGEHWCAVDAEGTVRCEDLEGATSERDGTLVAAGADHSCALAAGGRVICWGEAVELPDEEGWVGLSAGDGWTCGVHDDGHVACWGGPQPELEVETVEVGAAHACGLTSALTVHCWGENDAGQLESPEGEFVQVSAGGSHSCGITTDGAVSCWGDIASTPDRDDMVLVSAGAGHACGLTSAGEALCWGDDTSGQASPPISSWRAISAGGMLSCGLTASAHTTCWGAGLDPEI